jgi:hypothetical protein
MQTHLSDLGLSPFGASAPRRTPAAWLSAALVAYAAGARVLTATLCAEHVCDIADTGQDWSDDWLAVPSTEAAKYAPKARHCHTCGQVFAPVRP